MIIFKTKMYIHTKTSEEVKALEKPAVAFRAGFGKTNARAPTVAGLVCPLHQADGTFSCPLCFFPHHSSLITFSPCFFDLLKSCCSHAQVFGRTLVNEFHIFYSHTKWNLYSVAILNGTCTL